MTPTKCVFASAALAVLGFNSGCNVEFSIGETLVGSGVPATETRETDPFSKIEVGGAMKVEVSIGETQSIQVSGDDNIVPLVTANVHDGTLKIQTEHTGSLDMTETLMVTIVVPELVGAHIHGACDVEVTGLASTDFSVDLSGASKLRVSGECETLTAEISGAASFEGESLKAKNAAVNVSGASNAQVHASESVSGEASGASNLRYFGDPADASVETSGASSAQAG